MNKNISVLIAIAAAVPAAAAPLVVPGGIAVPSFNAAGLSAAAPAALAAALPSAVAPIPSAALSAVAPALAATPALSAAPVSAKGGLETLAAPASPAAPLDAGLQFDGGVARPQNVSLYTPGSWSYEHQKLSRAHEIAMKGSLGVKAMFDDLASKNAAPKYVMETEWNRQQFQTTGDDPERIGEAKQLIFSQSMLREQSVEYIAAMIAMGIARHFFAQVYPESAEKTYIGWSVALRTFLEATGLRKSDVDNWTNRDDYNGGNPHLHKHFQFWYQGLNQDADVVRNGPYFKNKILLQQGDPGVAVRDSRGSTTLYGRSQNEPGVWWGNPAKPLTQAAAEAQTRFQSFIKKEFEWARNWVNASKS